MVLGEHPGSDLTITELCLALKTKLIHTMNSPRNSLRTSSVLKSAEESLVISIIMLRRMINYCDSAVYRLPPEILAAIASHLPDNKSLIFATRVCHLWRSTFLSSPRLWSHLTLENDQRTLVFLERSGTTPLSIDLTAWNRRSNMTPGLLKRITDRLITLRGAHSPLMDQILAKPPPFLRTLNTFQSPGQSWNPPMRSLPSLRSLAITDLGCYLFRVPHLTVFRLELTRNSRLPERLGDNLIDFLRSCPLLEVFFISYDSSGMNIVSTEAVHLPCLRSFTHESPADVAPTSLFSILLTKLSLPPTCDVTFTIETSGRPFLQGPWDRRFPTSPERSYLSDIKIVKTTANIQAGPITLKTEFISSKNRRISFNVRSRFSGFCSPLAVKKLLDFLESSGVIHSVETLQFERYPRRTSEGSRASDLTEQLQKFRKLKRFVFLQCSPALFLGSPSPPGVWCPSVETLEIHLPSPRLKSEPTGQDILEQVREVAVSRQEHGTPLKAVTLSLRDAKRLLRRSREQMEDLNSCVESVQVLESSF
ncbi:hypothetical protein BJ322DRAFT_1070122 [Thelephora terrestris]|uniref:F-box domain-containing protein n=1 Tax=Thelephora terrestris TaxID=56493 RepID=A0A9P6HBS1_9AGAM|nr:hypothetical protein BJ322DRAFT_1070122 [Thelephora terrestris]